MRTIRLELANIETVKALHIYLQYKLDLPQYYGRNLDALHDCLTEIGEDMCILVRTQGIKAETAAYLPRLMQVLEDAADENACLTIMKE